MNGETKFAMAEVQESTFPLPLIEKQKQKVGSMVVYRGGTFTVAISWMDVEEKGFTHRIIAEGISRRSYKDKPSTLGDQIALGRSSAALEMKLAKRIIYRPFMG